MTTLDDLAAAAEKAQEFDALADSLAASEGADTYASQDAEEATRVAVEYLHALADPTTVLRLVAVARAAEAYSPERDHDWRCEYRTAEAGWQPGDSPVIRCECGYDELQAVLAALRKESGDE